MQQAEKTEEVRTYVFPRNVWKAVKTRGLERSLKTAIPDEVYEDLKKELNDIEKQQ